MKYATFLCSHHCFDFNCIHLDDRLKKLDKELEANMGERENPLMLAKKLMDE